MNEQVNEQMMKRMTCAQQINGKTQLLTQVSGLQVQHSLSRLTIALLYHTLTLQGLAEGRGWRGKQAKTGA